MPVTQEAPNTTIPEDVIETVALEEHYRWIEEERRFRNYLAPEDAEC